MVCEFEWKRVAQGILVFLLISLGDYLDAIIFFRNQLITSEQHISLAKSFGDIEPPHPVYPHVDQYPEIVLLENDKNNPPDTDVWHTDISFTPNPPFASILYSKEIPSSGGDTLWSCLSSIYYSL